MHGKSMSDNKTVGAEKIILATGSSLDIPDIKGLKDALLTTDQILDMTSVPKSVLVWGEAGSLDVEMASLLNIFGSQVCIATPYPRILPKEDHDTSQRLAQAFREQGIQVIARRDSGIGGTIPANIQSHTVGKKRANSGNRKNYYFSPKTEYIRSGVKAGRHADE